MPAISTTIILNKKLCHALNPIILFKAAISIAKTIHLINRVFV